MYFLIFNFISKILKYAPQEAYFLFLTNWDDLQSKTLFQTVTVHVSYALAFSIAACPFLYIKSFTSLFNKLWQRFAFP